MEFQTIKIKISSDYISHETYIKISSFDKICHEMKKKNREFREGEIKDFSKSSTLPENSERVEQVPEKLLEIEKSNIIYKGPAYPSPALSPLPLFSKKPD